MIFKANEAVGGLKHAGLKWKRLALKQSIDEFVPHFGNIGLVSSICRNPDGSPATCAICGYAIVRLNLDEEWTLDVCSAMPVLLFKSPLFAKWRNSLPREKLPASLV